MQIKADDVYGTQFDMACEGVALTDEQALALLAYEQQWDAMAESERRRAEGAWSLVEWCVRATSSAGRRLLGKSDEALSERAERYRWQISAPDGD